jgi:DNA-binding CsgD family transcriptional regulator
MDGGSLVGRDEELDQIERFLARSDAELPAALILEGEAGIGKTTLFRAGVTRARAAGFRVLASSPAAADAGVAFAVLGDLFDGIPDAVLAALPPPQRTALEVALLRRNPDRPAEGRALALAVVNAIRSLEAEGHVFVAVDDAQWLDAPSRGVLEFAVPRLDSGRVGWFLCQRPGDPGDSRLALRRALAPERIAEVTVGPLSVGALRRLVRLRLGLSLRRPDLLRLREVSGGNPFYALELARTLEAGGGREPRLPQALGEILIPRLVALGSVALDALLVAALMRSPKLDEIETIAGIDDAWQALRQALDDRIVTLDDDRVRFEHPLYAAAVIEGANPARIAELHRRLARSAASVEERARHLAAAARAPDSTVAERIEAGARSALLRGAPEIASVLARRARSLTPPDAEPDSRRRGLLEAECLYVAGDHERGYAVLEEVAEGAPHGRDRAEVLFELARWPRDMTEAAELCERALASAGGDPALQSDILSALADIRFTAGDGTAIEAARLAIERGREARDRPREWRARALVACLDGMRSGSWDLETMRQAAEIEQDGSARPVVDGATLWLCQALGWSDRFDEARMRLEAILARAELDSNSLRAVLQCGLAGIEYRSGRWPAARALAVAAHEAWEQAGLEQMQCESFGLLAQIDASLGRVEDARHEAEQGLAIAQATADRYGELRFHNAHVILGLAAESWSTVVEHAEAALGLEAEIGITPSLAGFAGHAAEAHAALGQVDSAERHTERLEASAAAEPMPRFRTTALRSRGLVESARGDLDAALASLEGAGLESEQMPVPFERARTLFMLGRIQRRTGHRVEARATLELATALFDELGARQFAERAREELTRIPGRRPSPDAALTDAEQRIAAIVADGRSNREVAAALFLSVKTVEVTLTRVYRKLGVRSRSELARRFAGTPKD